MLRSKVFLAVFMLLAMAATAVAAEKVGRAVAYENKKVTIIEDKLNWSNPAKPDFSVLPAQEFMLADDPGAMAPKAGGRLRFDPEKKEVTIYNPASKAIETFAFEIIKSTGDVTPDNPLVSEGGKLKAFPQVDKAKCEVTIYSPRLKNVSTIKVPQKYIDLPTAVWDNGNDVKITFTEPGKATAFTNISKAK